jgi:hypothetical protein
MGKVWDIITTTIVTTVVIATTFFASPEGARTWIAVQSTGVPHWYRSKRPAGRPAWIASASFAVDVNPMTAET